MKVKDYLNQGINVQLVVSAVDLKQLFNDWQDERDQQLIATSNDNDGLLSADEVAEKFGVTRVTLWRWEKAGYLVPVKIGRKGFYKQSDVRNLLNNRED